MKKRKKILGKSKAMKIDALRFGLAGGIIYSFSIVLSTIIGIFGNYQIHTSMMREMYGMFGYGATWGGVFLGAIYGFVDGFFAVWIFALIYNWLIR